MAKKATQSERGNGFDGVIRREVDITVRAVDEEKRSLDFTASSDTIDSHGDIVEQDFDLKRFKKNPVLLWFHNRFGFFDGARPEDFLPIGHVEKVKIDEAGNLSGTAVFGDDASSPMASKVFASFKQKHLRAFSIGFRPGQVTEETVNGKRRYRLAKNELYEISAVPIPSNPDSVAKAADVEREFLRLLAGNTTAADSGQENTTMAMTDEEKAAYNAAQVNLGVAQKQLEAERTRAETAEKALSDERKIAAKQSEDAEKASKRIKELEATQAKDALDSRQSVKFGADEREDLEKLVADVGLERVCALLDKRADISLTQRVKVEGEKLPAGGKAPPAVEGESEKDGSADLAGAATKAASKSAA